MDYQTITWNVDGDGVLQLTLNRPDRLNAFTVSMCEELIHAFARACSEDQVRVVLVTGAGKAFCAGMDLAGEGNAFGLTPGINLTYEELQKRQNDPDILKGLRDTGGRVALAIHACPKPVIGVVNGVAIGVGATMLLPMDFRFAASDARFGFVFSRLGITPEACSTWFLPRIVGTEQALEWLYRGHIFDATEALAKGLVRAVHPTATLLENARDFALSLVQGNSAISVAMIRQMLYANAALATPLEAHLVESLAVYSTSQADGVEGVTAFREKRPPRFSGSVACWVESLTSSAPRFGETA